MLFTALTPVDTTDFIPLHTAWSVAFQPLEVELITPLIALNTELITDLTPFTAVVTNLC